MNADEHLSLLESALTRLREDLPRLWRWGRESADRLDAGARLLAVGNGGSAAHAQHLTAELVGRYRGERRALGAIALHAETSSLTALVNDYGAEMMFARQVEAHGRSGDILVALSTSGGSPNILAAVARAKELGLVTYAMTGPAPNPLQALADDALVVDAATPTVQEVHQVAVHLVCHALDERILGEQRYVPNRPAPLASNQEVAR